MQASNLLTQAISTQSAALRRFQSQAHLLLQWSRKGTVVVDVGLVIAGFFSLQQVLVQLCNNCWQISFLFALIGLMIVLMLGQHYLNQIQSTFVKHWMMVSSIVVTTLGMGMIACILITPMMG